MKIVSSAFLLLFISSNFVFGQNSVATATKTFSNGSGMEHASISVMVYDLDSKTVVSEFNKDLTLPTASTAKMISTATAIDILGPNYRAETRLYFDGIITEGVLNGNVWIRGGGDPTLGSKYYTKSGQERNFMKPWIDSLKALGITQINGAIIGDASEFGYDGAPDGWNWVDMGNYYGAGPSGLTIFDNLVSYVFTSGSVAGALVQVKSIEPEVPGLVYHNYVKASQQAGDNAYLYGAPFGFDRFGTGTIPVNQSSFLVKGSLPDPELQCAHEFSKYLTANGISVQEMPTGVRAMETTSSDKTYAKRTLVATHKGEKLSDIIQETNYRSVNLFAEHMVNLVGYVKTGNGSTASGLRVLENHLSTKFNTSGLHVNDGSGLSRTNAISAHHFVQLLAWMKTSQNAKYFLASLPVAGQSGTMSNVCKNQAGHGKIAAKSGSMTRIKSYSGYVDAASGKQLAFAIIVNNFEGSSSTLSSRMQTLMNAMASY